MWELRKFRTLLSGMLGHRQPTQRLPAGLAADWLPPVLGPNDWSIGILADSSARWYFDRR